MRAISPAALTALLLASVLATAAFAIPASPVRAAGVPKVAIVVGPVGSLTPRYRALADEAAAVARAAGARGREGLLARTPRGPPSVEP